MDPYCELLNHIGEIKAVSTHEHIGCMTSAGTVWPVWGFRGDVEYGYGPDDTCLMDLLLGPYVCWFAGLPSKAPHEGGYFNLGVSQTLQLWRQAKPYLVNLKATGGYQAIDKAFKGLYGTSMEAICLDDECFLELDNSVRSNYGKGFHQWNAEVFRKLNVDRCIKPVHYPYIAGMACAAENPADAPNVSREEERRQFLPILRVDDLMGYADEESPCSWKNIEPFLGYEITSIAAVDKMVDDVFTVLRRQGIVAIKQAQAYFRPLDFKQAGREAAATALNSLLANQDGSNLIALKDYIMGKIVSNAAELHLPYQIHIGVSNLPHSDPSLFTGTVEHNSTVNFSFLHCYPYISEAGCIAKTHANVYLDTSWLSYLSPSILYKALDEWISLVPYSRIMISQDVTCIEEFYGAFLAARQAAARVLPDKIQRGDISLDVAFDISDCLFSKNAHRLYQI